MATPEDLGGEIHTVTIDPTTVFTAPGTPAVGATGLSGMFTFNVSALPVPEPACGGLLALAAGALHRRRSGAVNAS